MKLNTSALAVLAALPLMSFFAAAAPTAEDLQDRVFGSIFYEYSILDSDKGRSAEWQNVDEGNGRGLHIGYRINKDWAIRAEFARQDIDITVPGYDVKGNRAGIDLMYHIDSLPVYVLGGVKNITTGRSASAANVGIGANFFATDNFAVFAEANRYQGISQSFADLGFKVGLSYVFGSAPVAAPTPAPQPTPAPAPVIGDADQDGVTDDKDQCANTPITDKVDSVGCSIFTETSVRIDLNAQFDNDSAVVKPEYHADIEKLANFLKRFPNTDVEVSGHASNVGTPAYNMALSQRRSDAVADVLVTQYGIDRSRVQSVGYGVTKPRAAGNTAAAHAVNRRIEANVTASVKKAVTR
ncbi:MAG: OmpA family protein [Gammaproteobacteria bacterium]|nr:OmpA family protein [Gammaproteobacteria bacterium]